MAIELLTSLVALPLLAGGPTAPAPSPVQEASPGVWIGVSLTEDDEDGLEVTTVHDGSPAERAGLRAGDRIMAAGGNELGSFQELLEELSERRPGSKLDLWVHRELRVQLDPQRRTDGRPLLGVLIAEDAHGVRITEAQAGNPARRAGVQAGDVIASVNGEPVRTSDELIARMGEVGHAESVVLGIGRQIGVVLAARPGVPGPLGVPGTPRGPGAGGAPRLEAPGGRGRVERADPPALRRRMEEPDVVPLPRARGQASLQAELAELAQDLRELRREIAELRKELDRMRRREGGER